MCCTFAWTPTRKKCKSFIFLRLAFIEFGFWAPCKRKLPTLHDKNETAKANTKWRRKSNKIRVFEVNKWKWKQKLTPERIKNIKTKIEKNRNLSWHLVEREIELKRSRFSMKFVSFFHICHWQKQLWKNYLYYFCYLHIETRAIRWLFWARVWRSAMVFGFAFVQRVTIHKQCKREKRKKWTKIIIRHRLPHLQSHAHTNYSCDKTKIYRYVVFAKNKPRAPTKEKKLNENKNIAMLFFVMSMRNRFEWSGWAHLHS